MIYNNGCSFTYGIGLCPYDEAQNSMQKAWPALLAEKLNIEHINEAVPGSSNTRIFRDTIKYLTTNSPDLVIVMWSDPSRTEFFRPGEGELGDIGMCQVTPQNTQNIKSFYHREAFESYYSFIHSMEASTLQTLTLQAGVYELCKARNIPLIQFQYKNNIARYTNSVIEELDQHKRDITVKKYLDDLNTLRDYLDEGPFNFGLKDESYGSFDSLVEDYAMAEYSMGHPC
jgi:hypothetical protein